MARRKPNKSNKTNKEVRETVVDERGKELPLNNNPSWYFKDAVLADQVSSISFNQFLGAQEDFNPSEYGNIVPTAMRILFNPSAGYSMASQAFSGINQADIKQYTTLSANNAKTSNYAPQDVGTLELALGQIIAVSEVGRRALGLAFTYNKRNWSYPNGIIEVAGFDSADLFNNLAKYRLAFNTLVNTINRIAFPADIAYFAKCQYMYSHVFLDSESPMAQSYVYLPRSSWVVDETTYDGGTILKTIDLWDDTNVMTFQAYLTKLTTMINGVLESLTFNYIYADVLRLYGESQMYTVPFIEEGYLVMPEYDPLALLQINNINWCGQPNGASFSAETGETPSNDVYPDVVRNRLLYMPQFEAKVGLGYEKIINFPHSMGNPDVTQRIECTRFAMAVNYPAGRCVATMGDHYCVSISIWRGGVYTASLLSQYVETAALTKDNARYNFTLFSLLNKFEWGPRKYYYDGTNGKVHAMIGDLDYYTTVDFDYLRRVNDLTMVSLFS
jgi:hypothetical protein